MEQTRKHTSPARKFLKVRSLKDFSLLLKLEPYTLLYIARTPVYRSFQISKSNGGKRNIDAPGPNHLIIQKRLNRYLQHVYLSYKPGEVHGFVIRPNKDSPVINIRSNATAHTGKGYLVNIDLKDFFHSISAGRVKDIFIAEPFNFPTDLSSLIAILTTWYNKLPMGAPTSPVISNMACLSLDEKLIALAEKHQFIYSRYADDLTYSGDKPPDDLFLDELRKIIEFEGFTINNSKFRIQTNFTRQVVTGITVNEKPNLPRKYYRNLRAILHNWETCGIESAASRYYETKGRANTKLIFKFYDSIRAKIEYLEYIRGSHDPLASKLKEQFYRNKLSAS